MAYKDKVVERAQAAERSKLWAAANKERKAETSRRNSIKRKYGLTVEQYEALLRSQDNRCAICKTDIPGGRGFWHIDHCHSSGAVRGVLCHYCNVGLGNFKDNPETLAAAINYLR